MAFATALVDTSFHFSHTEAWTDRFRAKLVVEIFFQKDFYEENSVVTLTLAVNFGHCCSISRFRNQSFWVDYDFIIFRITPNSIYFSLASLLAFLEFTNVLVFSSNFKQDFEWLDLAKLSVNSQRLILTVFSDKDSPGVMEVSLSFAIWEDFFNQSKLHQDWARLARRNVCKVF